MNRGLYVGTVWGIRIRIHWLLLGFWIFELEDFWPTKISYWLLLEVLVFGHIFLHELGHCFAARSVGGQATDVLLWPLGGLAYCSAPNLPGSQFKVAAGGPLVSLLIVLFSYAAFGLASSAMPELKYNGYYHYARYALTKWSLYVLIFNLIPLYPLDGGRMYHAIAWGFLERKRGHGYSAYTRATLATVWASRVTAALGVIYGLYQESMMLVIIFIWAWSGAEALRKRLQEEEGLDYAFGHDFSRGYTSLKGSRGLQGERKGGGFFRRLFARSKKSKELSDADERRLDELLEKISRDGMGSLTPRERRFLEKLSRRRKD